MRAYGTYHQPAGTWSDDPSMTLCTIDSLAKGLNYEDMIQRFSDWLYEHAYTPYGETFDIGITTKQAINRFAKGEEPLKCGSGDEYDNGNGSLIRILPVLFYLKATHGTQFTEQEEAFDIIHNVSALTHAHKRSQLACGIYILIASELTADWITQKSDMRAAIKHGLWKAETYYKEHETFQDEWVHFERLTHPNFSQTPIEQIKSSGYVVDTLEAAVWCLLNTESYEACVLLAVNLGEDTDTVASIAGGLAGIYYRIENIPGHWMETIARVEFIKEQCGHFYKGLVRASIDKLTAYIPFFENATKESVSRWVGEGKEGNTFIMPYPVYDPTLEEFIHQFYQTPLKIINTMTRWNNMIFRVKMN